MARERPEPISAAERTARWRRVARIARRLGFVGRIEYRHIYGQAGGAQYGFAAVQDQDVLIVDADGFERDANGDDFSLEAMIAHECGHQRLLRDPRLQKVTASFPGDRLEEILASLVGSLLLPEGHHADTLVLKATVELNQTGMSATNAAPFAERLRRTLRELLS